ncbi:MAG: sugar phosphate isomerase/epimerase [Cytophagales bacterium]|nr:sugar phosphate isomerase/epimerase [Cytophagales bacterium]
MKSRRDFIIQSGLLAGGAMVLPACGSGSETKEAKKLPEQVVLKAKWNVGLQMYTLRNEIQQDLEGTLRYVADLGYNEVELFGFRNGEYFGRPASEVHRMVKDLGMSIPSSHYLSGRTQEAQGMGTLKNGWDSAIEAAVDAGQTHMVIAYLFDGERETLDQYSELEEMLNNAGEACKEAGIQLCYHNHAFEFEAIDGTLPMYHLLDNTDPNLLKVELDLYWVYKAGLDPLDFFKKYPGRTELWHVKDIGDRGDDKDTTLEVGEGRIPFKDIFAAAGQSGLTNFFVEQDHSPNPKESVKLSLSRVKELLA